ncbi:MAG: hypothetical protein HY820_31780 [Acidobacteria bacterium]|nr:hypothetical protein [Acidobacteriota bacterium]
MKMKTITLLGLLSSAMAAYGTPACTNNTLAFYQANYNSGCLIGTDYVASNFSYLTVGVLSTPVTPSDIQVTPSLGVNGPNLGFGATWSANGVGLSESAILFQMDVVAGAPFAFNGVTLGATGSVSGLIAGASVTEVDCLGGLLNVRSLPYTGLASVGCLGGGIEAGTSLALSPGIGVSAQAQVVFSPIAFHVDVLKNIAVTGVLGSASVTSVSQAFSTESASNPVPEPSTALFLCFGLGAILTGRVVRMPAISKLLSERRR